MSPKKKRAKLEATSNELKRQNEAADTSNKRLKSVAQVEDIQAMKRKNFVKACEQVSYNAYIDHASRLQLMNLPNCMGGSTCKHHEFTDGPKIKQMPSFAEESFKIEMKTSVWSEALEVCFMCITPEQYLSANVLRDVVEIILNAHDDICSEYSVSYLINKCQQVLALNFNTHPPCLTKSIRKCYINFLTSPMELKDKTLTNRNEFGYDKGIVKYCMNRLEYEISAESKEEALVDKCQDISEEMKQSVKGLYLQKEKYEIFESLERPERIERIMAVMESIVELLQYDLAIWHSRYTNNLGCHVMRSHKPFMAYILWSNNVLHTGAVNNNCRQILRIFAYFVHLQYPEHHIKTMIIWLNLMIQTFYICENNANSDYPNIGKYCTAFATEFYKIIAVLPNESIERILERIQPSFMQNLIGIFHLQNILSMQETDIISLFINIIKTSELENYPKGNSELQVPKYIQMKHMKIKKISKYLSKKCKNCEVVSDSKIKYAKFQEIINDVSIDQSHIVLVLYITFESYIDAYSVQKVQEKLNYLNDLLLQRETAEISTSQELVSYSVTEQFIKKYRSIYQMLKELIMLLHERKTNNQLPDIFKIFENVHILGL